MALYAVFGTSRHLKVTTSSSIAIMSASVVAAIAASDPSSYLPLSAGLAVIVGLILVVAGVARLGFLSQFLAASVVTGFVIGLAVVITVGQIPALLGIPAGGATIIEKLVNIVENLDELNAWTAWLGAGTVVGIVVLRRFARRIPGALVALVVGIGLSTLLDLEAHGVAVVGDVVTGIPPLSIPRVPFGDIVFLIAGAFGIVFLALAESIGAARSFAARHGYEIDPNQELVALGAANVGAGLFGGFSVDASFSQSATGEAAGNRTQLASLITAGLILATAVVLAPLFANLPLSVLAAIVITSVLGLVNLAELRRYLAWKRTDFLLAMTALAGVVFTTPLTGMAIAVALSLLAILYQASRPYIAVLARIPGDPPIYADTERHQAGVPVPGFLIVRPNVPLTFVNADVARDQIVALVAAQAEPPRAVVLDIAATADLDVATTDMLATLFADLGDDGIELRLAQVRGSVRDRMRRTGLMTTFGEARCYLSTESAVADPLPERPPPEAS
jgi:high affinity sulfate transporter 1